MLLTSTARLSPTLAQNTLVPTIKTLTHVDPENLKLMRESLYRLSVTAVKALVSWSFTSVLSTTLCCNFA